MCLSNPKPGASESSRLSELSGQPISHSSPIVRPYSRLVHELDSNPLPLLLIVSLHHPGGHSGGDRKVGNRRIDHRVGPDDTMLAYAHARQDHDILAQPSPRADSDRRYAVDALTHNGDLDIFKGVGMVRDVHIPGQQHIFPDDDFPGGGNTCPHANSSV